jgi:nitrate reductase / nitrite oxidoreductase, beta subunit
MDIRAQVSMVFHLDKCIGCHTCSVACKNIWTDRTGAEYMWWNNVETKPGTGYPTLWEDQGTYRGGWEKKGEAISLRQAGRLATNGSVFANPRLPGMDDYYEPWTYRYDELLGAPAGQDQPAARPVSSVTGRPIEIEAGPNWDDDLGGSPLYARGDPNLLHATEEERRLMHEVERNAFFYIPRICNHCLNPSCVASCPSGGARQRAIYKRGEDGIVLINPENCRAWRMCVSGCPYKKVYYNWATGKSEKCILCYPRQEAGQVPACFHVCVGRIRYIGLLLYDAERLVDAAAVHDRELVEAQRAVIQDPFDPKVEAAAKAAGLSDATIEAARRSPVYKFVKKWKIALPLTPQFRTLPMLFYVPPLLPLLGTVKDGRYDLPKSREKSPLPLFSALADARFPIAYMASLFAAGNEPVVEETYRKMIAVRAFMRARQLSDTPEAEVRRALALGETNEEEVTAIYNLTARATYEEHFVLPPFSRETAIESTEDPQEHKRTAGLGWTRHPRRRA